MMATAYTIAGILLVGGLILGGGDPLRALARRLVGPARAARAPPARRGLRAGVRPGL